MEHARRQQRHEDLYRKTVRDTLDGIRNRSYTEEAAPRIIEGLRTELGQCIELLLISSEFYAEQMELLQGAVAETV